MKLTQNLYFTAANLREAAPYIRAFAHKKVVLLLNGACFDAEHLSDIAQDIALLHSLQIQPVVIVNPQAEIDPITQCPSLSSEALQQIQAICNKQASNLTAKLSVGLINSNIAQTEIPAIAGNFVVAKPCGILNGQDSHHFGHVRRIKKEVIATLLERDFIVMMSPLGFSPSGETYYLDPFKLTLQVAKALEVDKIIVIGSALLCHTNGEIIREWRPSYESAPVPLTSEQEQLVQFATQALAAGIQRLHFLLATEPGAIIQELYTRDGCGSMATLELYEQIRVATHEDTSGIFELIQPLEELGILVKRPREQIEAEILQFMVLERDRSIIGCCALHPFSNGFAELSCFVVSPDYRSKGQGDAMLQFMEKKARSQGIQQVFVLTTQTTDWFVERGFKQTTLQALPFEKQTLYNMQRNSKIFIKKL